MILPHWIRVLLCRWFGHQWGKGPGMGARCLRCGHVDPPWDDLLRLGWRPRFKSRMIATLTDAPREEPKP